MIQAVRSFVGGFLMGTADLVPGVSGGTIALVLGIYERLVSSVKEGGASLGHLVRFDLGGFRERLRAVEWTLILPLFAGILTAVILLASFIEHQIEERPTIVAGVFLGLVLASIVIAWGVLRDADEKHVLIAAVVGVIMFVVLGLGEGQASEDPSTLAFFIAGALAVCAMILPGISGSLILLMLGMYTPVLAAVSDRDLATVAVVALGAIVGLALFSQGLDWALKRYHDPVLAGLIGLMVGSTRLLWPWPSGVEGPELGAPGDDWPMVLLAAFLGAGAVWLISRLAPDGDESAGA